MLNSPLLCSFILLFNFVNPHITHQRSSISHLVHDEEHNKKPSISQHTDICKNGVICVPHVQCPAHVKLSSTIPCRTLIGRNGVCCTTNRNYTGVLKVKHDNHRTSLDPLIVEQIARNSRIEMDQLKSRERTHYFTIQPTSAYYGHFLNSRYFNMIDFKEMINVATRALELIFATKSFNDHQGLTTINDIEYGHIYPNLKLTPIAGIFCLTPPFCPYQPEFYRRIDGSCNNLKHTNWGTAKTPYSRLLPANYHDGVWSIRLSVDGQQLTSPRLISTTILSDLDVPHYDYTLMVMQFGQFLAHDITQSMDFTYENGSAISCCLDDGTLAIDQQLRHYACLPISIPENDGFYSRFQQGCMNFVRSVLAPNHDCRLGYAQQMNKVTHFIDGSSIYGSSSEQTVELRSFTNGQLKVFTDFGRDLLPLAKDPDTCLTTAEGSACFTSGDTRTNQMISLVIIHTIFLREHNRIARELAKLNPSWNDERLFQEARRIVVAEFQVIVYNEYLPVVIGDIAMEEFQLTLAEETDYAYDYDEELDPSVLNEFAAAAWRFGHSTVDGLLKVYGPKSMEEVIAIPEIMFQPGRLRKVPFMDEMLSTLITEPMQTVDNNLPDALTKYMFHAGEPFGIDLASLNIQRGRDHGLRSYNDYRELVGLERLQSFDEFEPKMAEKLQSVYSSVDDIDLWIGGLLETKAPGSIVGYTFRDIIAEQFYRLKKADRYFFENHPSINPAPFTPDQLLELRKITMARLICDNSDRVVLVRLPLNVFKKPGVSGNKFVDCDSPELPKINLNYWKIYT